MNKSISLSSQSERYNNMIIFPDFVLQTVVQETLEEISNDSNILDQLFSEFKRAHFNKTYGQAEIDEIRAYFEKKQIRVVTSWSMVKSEYPCYSIQLLQSQEIDGEAALGDYLEAEFLGDDGEEVNKYPSSLNYPQTIPDHTSKVDVTGVPIRESILIGSHAPDKPNIARYMAWVLHYILRSKRNVLIDRGLDRSTIGFSDFARQNEYLPENIFTRFCTFGCVHYLTFKNTVNLLECDGIDVKITSQIPETDCSPGTTDQEQNSNSTVNTIE